MSGLRVMTTERFARKRGPGRRQEVGDLTIGAGGQPFEHILEVSVRIDARPPAVADAGRQTRQYDRQGSAPPPGVYR